MVHWSTAVQLSSVGHIIYLSTIFGFTVWTGDVRQPYLQSALPLGGDLYTGKVLPKFELEPHQLLKILRPLYEMCDSGDLWNATIDNHHRNILETVQRKLDPAL